MKNNAIIAGCAALLVLIGIALISMTLSSSANNSSLTSVQSYSWYVMPKEKNETPICADDAPFKDEYPILYCGKSNEKKIYLTFDLGYDNGNTEKILDALKEKNIKAAFFICGHVINTCPNLVKRMVEEGHLVCNHTKTHRNLAENTSKELIIEEISLLEKQFKDLTGTEMPKIVRPPEGRYNEETLRILKELGYTTAFWSFAYKDWINEEQPLAEDAISTVLNRTHPGMIALLHSTSATNAQILPELITLWQQEGYTLCRLDALIS